MEEQMAAQAPITEASYEADKLHIKALLDAQPKRMIRIRDNQVMGKPVQNYEFVCINGHNYYIQKGVDVEVPQTVFDILVESGVI